MVSKVNMQMMKGDSETINVTLKNADTGATIDISSYDFFFTIKSRYQDSDADSLYQSATSDWSVTSSIATLDIPAATTIDWSAGFYLYDIQFKNGSGEIITAVIGCLEVEDHVTVRTT